MPNRKINGSGGAATEKDDEICLDCGYVIAPATGHIHTPLEGYRNDEDSHWKLCACGEVMEKNFHVNLNTDTKCDLCGYLMSNENPSVPTDPSVPTEPSTPTNPSTPTEPSAPTEPSSSEAPSDNTEDVTTPPPTDEGSKNTSYVIWIVVAAGVVLGTAGGVVFVILNKKKK